MLEILLFGVFIVMAYLVAHNAVMAIEQRSGKPLGGWRTVWFFFIFLALLLIAQWLTSALIGTKGGPA